MRVARERLEILRPFQVTCGGRRVAVSTGAQRLPAFLALRREGTHRRSAAQQLWADGTTSPAGPQQPPAHGPGHARRRPRLADPTKDRPCAPRSARAENSGRPPPSTSPTTASYSRPWSWSTSTTRGTRPAASRPATARSPTRTDWWQTSARPCPPGWDDEGLLLERERWDQLRLYALEALAQTFQTERRHLSALQESPAAASIDPFCETPAPDRRRGAPGRGQRGLRGQAVRGLPAAAAAAGVEGWPLASHDPPRP